MYRALGALRRDRAKVSPQQFAILSEGPLDEISRLQQEVSAYAGENCVETYIGEIREIDLDEQSFILRNASEVHCAFDDEFLDAAKEALDRLVTVTGVRRIAEGRHTSHPLRIIRLEIMDEAGSGTAAPV